MTKADAEKLETICDELMCLYLGEDCTVSLALTGRLKISLESNHFIIMTKALDDVSYISFTGDFKDLNNYIDAIVKCVTENRGVFDKLIWSYEHRTELEG